ncbi:kinase-like domain-containing protein [Rhizophagus diaphanus]|nr:kinase-like domain-containing protein [Rhizophagus diaphanus] [Rhizophagus sp. MUCL 43196]
MAPEVLRGKSYTPASDIYSFSMIMWEFTSGVPPFNNRAHDIQLTLSICKDGERPEIIENTPQCYVDLMKKCWNEDPLKRPSSKEVFKLVEKVIFRSYHYGVSEELKCNIMEFINAPIGHNILATKSHSQACYSGHLLDFTSKKLNEILESEGSQAYYASHFSNGEVNEMPISEDLDDYIKTDEIN